MSKPTVNYWLDLLIGAAFIASAVSGIVFLLPFPMDSVLGLSYAQWDVVHTWGSLLMIGGVLAHLALHWKWLTHMTRKTLLPNVPAPRRAQAAGVVIDTQRRGFLRLAGYTALVAGIAVTGYEVLNGVRNSSAATAATTATGDAASVQAVEVEQFVTPTATPAATDGAGVVQAATETPVTLNLTPTSTPAPVVAVEATPVTNSAATSSRVTVACRKGQVNCPYPGRCHSYRDSNGNGYCDLSQPA